MQHHAILFQTNCRMSEHDLCGLDVFLEVKVDELGAAENRADASE